MKIQMKGDVTGYYVHSDGTRYSYGRNGVSVDVPVEMAHNLVQHGQAVTILQGQKVRMADAHQLPE